MLRLLWTHCKILPISRSKAGVLAHRQLVVGLNVRLKKHLLVIKIQDAYQLGVSF